MRALIFTIIVVWAVVITAQAQSNKYNKDAVYLKDGSVLRGELKAYEIGSRLRLRISKTATIEIPADKIDKVVQNEPLPKQAKGENATLIQPDFQKFYHTIAAYGLGGHFESDFQMGLGAQYVFGKWWNRWLATGIGGGYDNYYLEDRISLIPVFAEVKGQFFDRAFSPSYTIQAGYGFANPDEEINISESKGGVMVNPTIGLIKHTASGNTINIDLGYRFQRIRYTRTFDWTKDFEQFKILHKRLVVRFGLTF